MHEIVEAGKKAQNHAIKTVVIVIVLALLGVAAYFLGVKVIIPANRYRTAENMLAEGAYDEARNTFLQLGDYKDATSRAVETYYTQGLALIDTKNLDAAFLAFQQAQEAGYDEETINSAIYQKAHDLYNTEDYNSAVTLFKHLGKYSDAKEKIKAAYYKLAEEQFAKGEYIEAIENYHLSADYKDAEHRQEEAQNSCYNDAINMVENGEYEAAEKLFDILGTFKNSSYYSTALKIRSTNFDDGDSYSLGQYYSVITKLTEAKSFKEKMLEIPQMKTVSMLEGVWYGGDKNKWYFAVKNGDAKIYRADYEGIDLRSGRHLHYSKYGGYYLLTGWEDVIWKIKDISETTLHLVYTYRGSENSRLNMTKTG